MSTLIDRVKTVLTETGIEQLELAKAAGVSKGTVSQWLDGQIKSMKLEYAIGIRERFGYNSDWLVLGRGEKKVSNASPPKIKEGFIHRDSVRITTAGTARLSDDGSWATIEGTGSYSTDHLDVAWHSEGVYAIRCEGDAMTPRIKDGEYLIVDSNIRAQPGDEVIVRRKDGQVAVKIFLYQRGSRTFLLSVNSSRGPTAVESDDIEQMHYVAAIVKPAVPEPA